MSDFIMGHARDFIRQRNNTSKFRKFMISFLRVLFVIGMVLVWIVVPFFFIVYLYISGTYEDFAHFIAYGLFNFSNFIKCLALTVGSFIFLMKFKKYFLSKEEKTLEYNTSDLL